MYSLTQAIKQNIFFTIGAAFALLMSAYVLFGVAPHASARLQSCDSNAVMYCGFSSKSDFINQTKNGDRAGHKDLARIYGAFGFTSGDYARFIDKAQRVTFKDDGRIVASDGKVIATQAFSYGRSKSIHEGPSMKAVTAGSTTVYGNYISGVITGDHYGYVLYDATGTPEFFVMDNCGNPVTAKVVKSNAVCDSLSYTAVAGKLNTYSFTSKGSASGFASITKYVYDFGDGSGRVTKTSGSSAVTHEYKKEGTFTAKVTVYASAPGSTTITSSTSACQKKITVKLPYYSCVRLDGALLDQATYKYRFDASIRYGNGAEFISADFDFGDGKTETGVKSSDGTLVSVEHTYAKPGNYSASAVLRFSVNGKTVTAPTCRAMVTPTAPPIPECKPGIPVGDIRCNPCPYDASISADDERCEAPVTELPNTGAGNVVAIGSIALIGGFLGYRHMLFRRHKRAYLAAEQGTSPLPLANALETDKPLEGTPLEDQASRSTFRRRRQF